MNTIIKINIDVLLKNTIKFTQKNNISEVYAIVFFFNYYIIYILKCHKQTVMNILLYRLLTRRKK